MKIKTKNFREAPIWNVITGETSNNQTSQTINTRNVFCWIL